LLALHQVTDTNKANFFQLAPQNKNKLKNNNLIDFWLILMTNAMKISYFIELILAISNDISIN